MKIIKDILASIYQVIDKVFILPITKFVFRITKKFDRPSKWLENWLSKSNTLLFISLILSIFIFIVIDQKILFFSRSSAEVLKQQPVVAVYNEDAYVIEGLPEFVDITLIGSKTDLYIAKQSPTNTVQIDLSGYTAGQYKVDINYNNVSSSLEYSVNPSFATVTIYPKISKGKTLTIDVLNQDNLDDKLVIEDVKVPNEEVVIKGAEYQVSKVATVKALVDINNLVKQQVGTHTLKDVPLKAYDEQGNVVDVEIVPGTIDAEVVISSPSKEVPIKVIPKGEVAFGGAISAISSSVTKVTVYGTKEAIANLEYVPVEIDVTGLTEDRQYKMELVKPSGIKSMSVSNVTVDIAVISEVSEKTLEVIIDFRNVKNGYSAQGSTPNDYKAVVRVKGVPSVIKDMVATDVTAYVDLSTYKEGQKQEVEVHVEGIDVKVQYVAVTKKITVDIYKN